MKPRLTKAYILKVLANPHTVSWKEWERVCEAHTIEAASGRYKRLRAALDVRRLRECQFSDGITSGLPRSLPGAVWRKEVMEVIQHRLAALGRPASGGENA